MQRPGTRQVTLGVGLEGLHLSVASPAGGRYRSQELWGLQRAGIAHRDVRAIGIHRARGLRPRFLGQRTKYICSVVRGIALNKSRGFHPGGLETIQIRLP